MSEKFERLTGVNECKTMQVIQVKSLAGNGDDDSVMHEVTEYYSLEGELLARRTYKDKLDTGRFFSTQSKDSEEK